MGTSSGHRFVVGRWWRSPLGAFADVFWERPDGTRVLLAPTSQVAEVVTAGYHHDDVQLCPVTGSSQGRRVRVRAGSLDLSFDVGAPTARGRLLAAVPAPLTTSTTWAGLVDPLARLVQPGTRTAVTLRDGRRQWYLPRSVHHVVAASALVDGVDCGPLADVVPPVRFGSSSVPRSPALVRVRSVIEWDGPLPTEVSA